MTATSAATVTVRMIAVDGSLSHFGSESRRSGNDNKAAVTILNHDLHCADTVMVRGILA